MNHTLINIYIYVRVVLTFVEFQCTLTCVILYTIHTSSTIKTRIWYTVIDVLTHEGGAGNLTEPRGTAAFKVTRLGGGGAGRLTQLGGVAATVCDIPKRSGWVGFEL